MSSHSRRETTKALVGRRDELHALERLLDVEAPAPHGAAVIGEAGIGKTRLLGELTARAAGRGYRVAAGRGSELEQDVPFGLLTEVLRPLLREESSLLTRRLSPTSLDALTALVPLSEQATTPAPQGLEVERYRYHHAIHEAVALIARERPLVIVLDDLHWGDPASLEAAAYMAGRETPGLVLAFGLRPGLVDETMTRAIERAAGAGQLLILRLTPLTPREAGALLQLDPGSPPAQRLYAASEGNPFYLEQLARVPGAPGGPAMPGESPELPHAVRAAIEHELRALPPRASLLLRAAAIAGDPTDSRLAAEIAELPPDESDSALEQLLARDLLRSGENEGQLTFRHPLVTQVVYETSGYGWRRGAHRRANRLLEERGASLERRAHHVERYSDPGDSEAIALLASAGNESSSRAPASATRWYRAALRLTPDDAIEGRVALLLPLANSLSLLGQLHESRDALSEALALLPEGAPLRGRLIAMIAQIEQGLGHSERARRHLAAALDAATPGTADAVMLRLELAKNSAMSWDWPPAAAIAAQGLQEARRLDDPPLVLTALALSAFVGVFQDRGLPALRAWLEEAATGIDELSDAEMGPELLEALQFLGHAEASFEQMEAVARHCERGMRLARASHAGHYFIQFSSLYAAAQGFRGELDDALRAAQSATDAAQTLGNDQLQAFAEATLAWITSMRGDHESALAAGERAIRAVERAPHALFGWYAYCCHGETLVDAGEYRRGRKVILRAGGEGLERIPPAYRAHWQRSLALAALELGDVEGAAAAARHTDPDLGEKGFPIHQGNGHYVRACAALAAGESALAGERALAAAAEYASGGIPIEEARARLLAGRALATAGEKDAAEQQLREAYDAFVARGAVRLADRTAQELRRLGVSSPKPRVRHRREEASEHLALLTDRERVVAAAVAEGLANREIAARLFVSEKTVEAHLTKIFGKLGVASRTALAGVIAQDQGPHQR